MTEDFATPQGEHALFKKNPLQQMFPLEKYPKESIVEMIRKVLESPNIYLFGDMLGWPYVQELKDSENVKWYNTLQLFAYGTFKQYRQEPSKYIELTPQMQKKLQHLTIVSLAIENKSIPYALLMHELEIDNVRQLEDIIIEAIYAEIVHGKMFQKQRLLEIDFVQGRDIPTGYVDQIEKTLAGWLDSCEETLKCIDDQIEKANAEKGKRLHNKERVEKEINNIKETLKNQMETDDTMQIDSREGSSTSQEARKKTDARKTKTTRPSVSLKFSK